MLTIRREQLAALDAFVLQSFECEMATHLESFTPAVSKVIGENGRSAVVKLGLAEARRYGFTLRGPLRLYIESMTAFGSGFDTDPGVPWASSVLKDPRISDQMLRADELYRAEQEYFKHVAGPDNSYAIAALRRVMASRFEDLPSTGSLRKRILGAMHRVYPEKCDYLGDNALLALIDAAMESAEGHGVTTEQGSALIGGLMFGFGHKYDSDPLYPWIASTLTNPLVPTADGRAARLADKVNVYSRAMLKHYEESNG